MALHRDVRYKDRTFRIPGIDAALLFGSISLASILLQVVLAWANFAATYGFIFALILLANPIVFGVLAVTLARTEAHIHPLPFTLGVVAYLTSYVAYYQLFLPHVQSLPLHTYLPVLAFLFTLAGALQRLHRSHARIMPEVICMLLGTGIMYITYIALGIEVLLALYG